MARTWLIEIAAERAPTTQVKVTGWLKKDAFSYLGTMPIESIKPRDVLLAVQRMEAHGAVQSAHRVRQICSQVFRCAVAAGIVERDVTAELKGALAAPKKTHYAAIITLRQTTLLMKSIYSYSGHPYAVAALKLTALLFVRPAEFRATEWSEFKVDASCQVPLDHKRA